MFECRSLPSVIALSPAALALGGELPAVVAHRQPCLIGSREQRVGVGQGSAHDDALKQENRAHGRRLAGNRSVQRKPAMPISTRQRGSQGLGRRGCRLGCGEGIDGGLEFGGDLVGHRFQASLAGDLD